MKVDKVRIVIALILISISVLLIVSVVDLNTNFSIGLLSQSVLYSESDSLDAEVLKRHKTNNSTIKSSISVVTFLFSISTLAYIGMGFKK